MKGAGLVSEHAAGEPADEQAQPRAAGHIQRIVDTDIDLGVGDQKSPDEYELPPGTCMF